MPFMWWFESASRHSMLRMLSITDERRHKNGRDTENGEILSENGGEGAGKGAFA